MYNIKEKLDNYLDIDSDLLFNDKYSDYICIFGGAIRDIISGDFDKINDIDILGMSKSIYYVYQILLENGYKKIDLINPNIYEIYKDIKWIFEPITLINNNAKIVQLIRPSQKNIKNKLGTFDCMFESYIRLLRNVDLSSSGLFYDGERVYESIPKSFTHCKAKVFEVLNNALMYNSQRVLNRMEKLHLNGWSKIYKNDNGELVSSNILALRKLKIQSIKRYDIPSIDDYIKNKKSVYDYMKTEHPYTMKKY